MHRLLMRSASFHSTSVNGWRQSGFLRHLWHGGLLCAERRHRTELRADPVVGDWTLALANCFRACARDVLSLCNMWLQL